MERAKELVPSRIRSGFLEVPCSALLLAEIEVQDAQRVLQVLLTVK